MVRYKSADSPAVLLHRAGHPRKTDFFCLEEKIGRAQNPECKGSFSGVQSRFIGTTAGLASIIQDFRQSTFELCLTNTAKMPNLFFQEKWRRPGGATQLHSPREIPNLKGCATPSVAPRLPMHL